MVTMDDEIDLRSVDVFAGVPTELYLNANRREYRTGEAIMTEGSVSGKFVILTRGSVEILRRGTLVKDRQAVAVLGEQALLEEDCHSATILAHGAVSTAEYDPVQAQALLADPTFARNLAREISRKLRGATDDRGYRYGIEDRLFPAFRAHASTEVLNELVATGLDGLPRQVEAAILFTDIRGFTALTADMPPSHVAEELTAFLDLAVGVLHRHGAIVDKFIGDAVMAIWAYPEAQAHAVKALGAARELVVRSNTLSFGGQPLRIGVGIEAGVVFLGSVGGEGKRQFTALGAVVNRAARVESETKHAGLPICLGPGAVERLRESGECDLIEVGRRGLAGLGEVPIWGTDPMSKVGAQR